VRPARAESLAARLRELLPLAITLLTVLLAALPFGIAGMSRLMPDLALIGVYYWTIHRPDLFSTGAAFVVGLLADVLSGGPFGVNTLVLVLVQLLTRSQRPALAGKSFSVAWLGFLGIATCATALFWLANSIAALTPLDPSPAMLRLALGILVYPLYALAIDDLQRRLLLQV